GCTRGDPGYPTTVAEHRSGNEFGGTRRSPRRCPWVSRADDHSHSMVPGGFEVTSRTTRLMSSPSLVLRSGMVGRTAEGLRVEGEVIARTTRLMSSTSLVMRLERVERTS